MISCNSHDTSNKIYFIIKGQKVKEYQQTTDDPPPPPTPPPLFYAANNFILFGNDKIYYHNRSLNMEDLRTPPFLDIKYSEIRSIKYEFLEKFLETEIPKDSLNTFNETIIIKSSSDTIRNPAFQIIIDYLTKNGCREYLVQKWTEEEKDVLNRK
jgi:hypothetical protein